MNYLENDREYHIIPSDLYQTFQNKFTVNIGNNELIKMRNNGIITDRDMLITKFLFKFQFATIDQLYRLLNDDKAKVNLKNRLDKLVVYRILNKFMLSDMQQDKIENDAFEIYCLDLGGRYLLSHYTDEDTSDWYSTVNMKCSEIISKQLLSTEIYLRIKETCPGKITHFKSNPEYRVGKKNVIPSFELRMNLNGQIRYFIGEIFRDIDYPTNEMGKVEKLESFLTTNAWRKYIFDSDNPPILFVFTDTDETALLTSKLITETSEIRNFRVSTDDRIQRVLYDIGAFLKYNEDTKTLQEIKAVTFKP